MYILVFAAHNGINGDATSAFQSNRQTIPSRIAGIKFNKRDIFVLH